jgi:hypothetical protein
MSVALIALSAALAGAPAPSPSPLPQSSAAADSTFSWSGTVPSGGWLRIRNLKGSIEVRRGSGSSVTVAANPEPDSNRWWNDRPVQPVRFVTQRQGNDVIVCAISDDMPRCDADALSRDGDWFDDWNPRAMHIVVQLPAGVALQVGTMHGDVRVDDAGAAVIARSGHGDLTIDRVAGPLDANTGHGKVDIRDAASRVTANSGHGNIYIANAASISRAMTGHGDVTVTLAQNAANDRSDMRFESGHGNVRVTAPRSLAGDVDLRTGHGQVSTDFPLKMEDMGRRSRSESAYGTLGAGGRSVRISTGHGNVELRAS